MGMSMSERARELAQRQASLLMRCEQQRHAIAQEVASIEMRFDAVDRVAAVARGVLRNPAVIAAGIVALLTLGRVGGFRLLGRALLLATAARRLLQALKTL